MRGLSHKLIFIVGTYILFAVGTGYRDSIRPTSVRPKVFMMLMHYIFFVVRIEFSGCHEVRLVYCNAFSSYHTYWV